MTRIENASARVTSRMMNELVYGTDNGKRDDGRGDNNNLDVLTSHRSGSVPAEKTGRLYSEDHRHRRIKREIRYFGEQGLSEIVGEADQQARRSRRRPGFPFRR